MITKLTFILLAHGCSLWACGARLAAFQLEAGMENAPQTDGDKAASFATWSQRSRNYLDRIRAEAPAHVADWKLFDELNHAGAAFKPHFDRPPGAFYRRIEQAPGGLLGLPFLIDLGIEGFLHKSEALKLYEMGFHTRGDVLELGTHKGLSTSILAQALHDRGSGKLVTVDIAPATNEAAKFNLSPLPGNERVDFRLLDASAAMDGLKAEQRSFGFIFVDHWHGYDATYEAAARVSDLLWAGGFVMFHDFFDASNRDPEHVYGVYQAVIDKLGEDPDFMFDGAAGGAALFRKRS
jgi:SAM-dependent methyltransferase